MNANVSPRALAAAKELRESHFITSRYLLTAARIIDKHSNPLRALCESVLENLQSASAGMHAGMHGGRWDDGEVLDLINACIQALDNDLNATGEQA